MRLYLIATSERRARQPFMLKDLTGRKRFGGMTYNLANGRHEMEVTEKAYLEMAKYISLLGRIPGCAVHVAGVREVQDQKITPIPTELSPQQQAVVAQSTSESTAEAAQALAQLPEGTHWKTLEMHARVAGINPADFQGKSGASELLRQAINDKRKAA